MLVGVKHAARLSVNRGQTGALKDTQQFILHQLESGSDCIIRAMVRGAAQSDLEMIKNGEQIAHQLLQRADLGFRPLPLGAPAKVLKIGLEPQMAVFQRLQFLLGALEQGFRGSGLRRGIIGR